MKSRMLNNCEINSDASIGFFVLASTFVQKNLQTVRYVWSYSFNVVYGGVQHSTISTLNVAKLTCNSV